MVKVICDPKADTFGSWGRPGVSDACRVEVQMVEQAKMEPWYKVAGPRKHVPRGTVVRAERVCH